MCSSEITYGIVSHLAVKVLETLADGSGTSQFPPRTAPLKPAVQEL